jgi:hypothetical protein
VLLHLAFDFGGNPLAAGRLQLTGHRRNYDRSR